MNNLRCKYESHTKIGEDNIVYMVTPIGNIEKSEWIKKVEDLSAENKEENVINKLYGYTKEEIPWLKMKEFKGTKDMEELKEKKKSYQTKLNRDIKMLALKYYAMRIWEDANWVDHDLFNNLYLKGNFQMKML